MSGIVGIINTDGAPVDRSLLQGMADAMAFRGPDAQDVWVNGHVGFGHAMLRTTRESERERQPYSLDGQVWITADARVDDRAGLIRQLEAAGRGGLNAAPDAELILHAYHAWGEDCAKRLIGDFAFAVWDEGRRRLFCARDHFGVKPFYYARVGSHLVFGNTLNCVRLHPAVSDELNELAVGDFLLFDFNQDLSTTIFADIQRLPPAHCLTFSSGNVRLTRYWTLPTDGHIRYRKASDYVEHFGELLHKSVEDRLRTDRVGVLMSGGLDSSSVAAIAHRLLSEQSSPFDLRAYTTVYDWLIPDEERHYAGLVAEALGIPIHYHVADDYDLFEGWGRREPPRLPEPVTDPLGAANFEQSQEIARHCRVLLTGNGGDPLLYPSTSYFFYLLKRLEFGLIAKDVAAYFLSHGRLPQVGIRTKLKSLLVGQPVSCEVPAWLVQDFIKRTDLRERCKGFYNSLPPVHPVRPEAYNLLTPTPPYWPFIFEMFEPDLTFSPFEARHPFFDLRLVNYSLSIPPIPWCLKKEVLRAAMRGLLPEQIRLRPKTPLSSGPFLAFLRLKEENWFKKHLIPSPALEKYVNFSALQVADVAKDPDAGWRVLRLISFSKWLHAIFADRNKIAQEGSHGVTEGREQQETLPNP